MDKIVVTSYINPDLDGVSCAAGYAEFLQVQGKDAHAVITGTPHQEAAWLLEKIHLSLPQLTHAIDTSFILVDVSDSMEIDPKINLENIIEVIDHRKKISEINFFPNAKKQIELVGAAATLIAEKFKNHRIKPSKNTAILLYGGIVSNTLNFKAHVTTERDKETAAWLKPIGEVESDFIHKMFLAKSDLRNKSLKEVILSDLSKSMDTGGKKIIIAQLEIVGVRKLHAERSNEIKKALTEIKKEREADMIFLSSIDLEEGMNAFMYTNNEEKELLKKVLGAQEKNEHLVTDRILLRKEIRPMLHDYFTK